MPQWVSTDQFRRPKPGKKSGKMFRAWKPLPDLYQFNLRGKFDYASGKISRGWNLLHQSQLYRKFDYADTTTGAKVEMAFTSRSHTTEKTLFAGYFNPQERAAKSVFRSRLEGDGQCWEITGVTGTIAVWLSQSLTPTAIAVHQSIQHQLSSRANMAPRHLAIWALDDREGHKYEGRESKPISEFLVLGQKLPKQIANRRVVNVLDLEFSRNSGLSAQIFPITSSPRTNLIIVEVKGNWGGRRTCIQRIGVY
ncbi:hypothetical protein DFH06DRAFT_1143529 [Mycena polygramma]|nr:hypothetical protein DFH06DRAFT_1143529 [Mycena polygramma]